MLVLELSNPVMQRLVTPTSRLNRIPLSQSPFTLLWRPQGCAVFWMSASDCLIAALPVTLPLKPAGLLSQPLRKPPGMSSRIQCYSMVRPQEPLDLLEVYAESDSRLTQAVNDAGGRARRFTGQDGDLSSVEGHRLLYDMIQRYQPKHIMMAPECRLWGSWSVFNSFRSTDAHQRMMVNHRRDQVHLRLCARICRWQLSQGRHFHLEQPEQSRMLQQPSMQPVRDHTKRVVVEKCAFGLRTPVTEKPIRKRTVILSSNPKFVEHLSRFRCPGNRQQQQIARTNCNV